MEITFKESLNNLIELQKDYQQFHDDVWQDPKAYGITAESLRIGIETMRKYQKIQEIVNNTDAMTGSNGYACAFIKISKMEKIG